MIIAGFGMIHSTQGMMEIISMLLIGIGCAYLLFLLLSNKSGANNQNSDE